MKRRTFLTSATALAAASCVGFGTDNSLATDIQVVSDPTKLGFNETGLRSLDASMAAAVAKGEVPGISYIVGRHGQIAAFGAHGFASPERNLPVRTDTIFRIFSMTKPITGTAMMILFEQGKWKLDDPITRFLPEMANLKVATGVDASGQAILVPVKRAPNMAELMSHTAGFGYGISDEGPVDSMFSARRVQMSANLAELATKVAAIPLKYQPGENWAYSIAVDLQARIVEVISGKTFGAFLQEHVFAPLRMTDTSFYVPPEKRDRFADLFAADFVTGHAGPIPEIYASRIADPTDPATIESGGGGLCSTIGDYSRFCQMILNGGELDGARVLKRETVALMGKNQIAPGVKPSNDLLIRMGTSAFAFGLGVGFGLDFMVVEDPRPTGLPVGKGTLSWGGAAGTWFWVDPTNDLFFIGMIQRLGGSTNATDLPGEARRLTYVALNNSAA